MPVVYEIRIDPADTPPAYRLCWRNLAAQTENTFIQSNHALTREEVEHLWLKPKHHHALGQKLFRFLDGDARHLTRALDEAAHQGEPLLLHLRAAKEIADWPFELLAQDGAFLLPSRLHLLRQVSDWGAHKTSAPANRPLQLLFMACSALDVEPELDFEREEETIFRVTEKLAIDMEVEDSGSLAGLAEQLVRDNYDVVHLSGHADIDQHGQPFFIMETETGRRQNVTPAELWREALIENPPALLFLSGCRTGETPAEQAAASFAQQLVEQFHVPGVLSWGRSVSDQQATVAEQFIYRELSRGRDLLSAVQRARQELLEHFHAAPHQAWPLLRLYSDGRPHGPLVQPNQKVRPKPRQMVHTTLKNSQVKILETGFVGRRRQLQQSLAALQDNSDKVGALLHGAGGLGKSCLAGKLCERFSSHVLIIVHGRLDAMTLQAGLKDAFIAANDQAGLEILAAPKEMPEKLAQLCATCFKEKNYLFVLDDFEQNLAGADQGRPGPLLAEAVPLVQTLLHYLPLTGKMTQLLITSRYGFALTENERDLARQRLEWVPLIAFQDAEQRKKARELPHLWNYPEAAMAEQLLAAGHGNPRLMEWLNQLVGEMPQAEVAGLLAAVANKQEEFIRKHVIRELLQRSGAAVENFLRRFSVYRLPVEAHGAESIAHGAEDGEQNWQTWLHEGVRLSLVEHDHARNTYWLTPILREELWREISDQFSVIGVQCHEAAFAYYEKVCSGRERMDPILTEEWIYHALGCGREDVAARQGGELITFLSENLAYLEAKRFGEWILSAKQQLVTGDDAFLLNNLAVMNHELGEHQKAIGYYEQALAIDRAVYGDQHPNVATRLNNLGSAWNALGEPQKAIGYYVQALGILKQVYGEQHPNVASSLNNLGSAWNGLGEPQKAIGYYEQALAIWKQVYGEQHPNVAVTLNNLGLAWDALGEPQKAIGYYKQALAINRTVYGGSHPQVATNLNNLGGAWTALGEPQKAIGYYEQALAIDRVVYDDKHPNIATRLNNLGSAWDDLGDHQKAIGYYEEALAILKQVYGEQHPAVARALNNMGSAYFALGEKQKAKQYFQPAHAIFNHFFGPAHPNTKTVAQWLAACE
jgi:tetratricopeptide (TPR) repeat protein